MRITFRLKLLLILGTAALTLVSMLTVSALMDIRQGHILDDVEGRLVPKLELGPRLVGEFDRLRRGMQDAVAAQDMAALATMRETRDQLVSVIASAGDALPGEAKNTLRQALDEYYDTAYGVSTRLIAGESGEALVEAAAKMQAKHHALIAMIEELTTLERNELSSGFTAVRRANRESARLQLAIGAIGLLLLLGLSLWTRRGVLKSLGHLSDGFARFATGKLEPPISVHADDELGSVAKEANQMAASLKQLGEERDRDNWLKTGQSCLAERLRGELELGEVADNALSFLVRYVDAAAGALFLSGPDGRLSVQSHYALPKEGTRNPVDVAKAPSFRRGEGLVGQAALSEEILIIENPPDDYFKIRSGLGEARPRSLLFLPLSSFDKKVGVLELAFFSRCSDKVLEFLKSVRESVIIALQVASSRAALRDLLDESRRQAERLAMQEEELRVSNQELRAQQEELRQANTELHAQRKTLSQQNDELETARRRVQQQVEELAKVSSYKSQFLANMSHELRTPLNSMLLLSHLLAENEGKNLTPKQVEHCRTVHAAGQDLLGLINQVLDLAKIEAGKQEVTLAPVEISELVDYAERFFAPMAADKGLELVVDVAPGLPETLTTDKQRVERILTNLIGNAIKFTQQGRVTLSIRRPSNAGFETPEIKPEQMLAFAVSDTGIGLAPEVLERVFLPFEQVGSNSDRGAGGTGLGLAIARESAHLLGGELHVESEQGKGSTLILYLPERAGVSLKPAKHELHRQATQFTEVSGQRVPRRTAQRTRLLVIEDDPVLAEQLVELIRSRRFDVLVAGTGEEGLRLAREHQPQGIILDVKLPDIDGWEVMNRLRADVETRSIPVHFLSAAEGEERGRALGAIGFMTKPATREELTRVVQSLAPPAGKPVPRVLVVEDSRVEGESIVELLAHEHIEARHVATASDAFEALRKDEFECVILDLGLPDMNGLRVLKALRERNDAPAPRVIVHTGRALTKDEIRELSARAEAIVLKDGNSVQRLLEEVRLFVRHIRAGQGKGLEEEAPSLVRDISLNGKKLLLADDDMRTLYALSAFLRGKGAEVIVADTGKDALDTIAKHPDVQGVLIDVMMPEMDGYEAMRRLREQQRFAALPIIALTAKAMKGERERCIEAGANEYLPKPVDSLLLLKTLKTLLEPQTRR